MTVPTLHAPEDKSIAASAWQQWQQGQQDQALNVIRPQAEAGYLWALVLIVWFLHQRGEPGWREGIPFAERAADLGNPWPATYLVNQMMGQPHLRAEATALLRRTSLPFPSQDPIGWAQQAFQQGDGVSGADLLETAWPGPWLTEDSWRSLVSTARDSVGEIEGARVEVAGLSAEVSNVAAAAATEIETNRTSIQTKSTQLETLLEQITNAEVKSFFDEEASTNEKEARGLWWAGLAVVVMAALLAITPLALHYFGYGPKLSSNALLTAHLAPTAALAGVAGVLLSRSRGRDRTRQKARDLSIALGTVFVYAGQMADESEKQRFQHDMARAVIESFLRAETTTSDETTGLLSLLTSGGRA